MWYNGITSVLQESPPWGENKITEEYKQMFYSEWREVDESYRISIVLENFKKERINEINNDCKLELVSGIYSDALGEMHRYDSDIEDQMNFQQALAMAQMNYDIWLNSHNTWLKNKEIDPNYSETEPVEATVLYRIWDTNDITKSWYPHTYNKFLQVLKDGAIQKEQLLYKCSVLKNQVSAATTIEEVDAIMWV